MTRPGPTFSRKHRNLLLDLLLIFLLAAILVRPLFRAKYLQLWSSIESTFIADSRFLAGHWPHPLWQPLWYCGTRFDYIYPPVLRYGTALLTNFFIPVKAYHVFTALMFCLGIAGAGGALLVATPNVGSITSVAKTFDGHDNPQIFFLYNAPTQRARRKSAMSASTPLTNCARL
jgi:hypothetical protein